MLCYETHVLYRFELCNIEIAHFNIYKQILIEGGGAELLPTERLNKYQFLSSINKMKVTMRRKFESIAISFLAKFN